MKSGIIEDLQDRVRRLEKAVYASKTQLDATPDLPRSPSGVSVENVQRSAISRCFPDAYDFLQHLQNSTNDEDVQDIRRALIRLQRTLEAHNTRLLAQPDPKHPVNRFSLDLPPMKICERLSVLYFDNMEHCFRILYWPDFRRQLEILFSDEQGPHACSFAFLPQLVGAVGIGAILGTHEECQVASAYSLVHERVAVRYMEDFVQNLKGSQKYELPTLQLKMLILIFRWLISDPLVDLFCLSGEILRDALVMRMDRDPASLPEVSVYEGELRRKCWMTIVECDLMLSELCKLPCMVPPYTCLPPHNINDNEIYDGMKELPPSHPMEEWTDGLCQYLLANSFPRRLAACKQMEGASNVKFEDVLEHTRYIEKELQNLPPPLRFTYMGDEASKTPARLMARIEMDISIRRPLMHLYSCFASAPNAEDIQQEARAGFLQSCLMLATYQDLFDPQFSELNVPRPEGYWDFFYNVYRHELSQAILGLCLEIKRLDKTSQVPPESPRALEGGGTVDSTPREPLYFKGSLIQSVTDTLEPMLRRLSHTKVNLKDIVYLNVVLTSVLPQQTARPKSDMIKQALQKLVQNCQLQLERDGIPLVSISHQSPVTSQPKPYNSAITLDARFDPCWAEFPQIDVFEP